MSDPAVAALLRRALEHHRQGERAAADALYRQVLLAEPDQPDALQLLGVLLAQGGSPTEGETLLARAASVRPGADILANLGTVRAGLGRDGEAEEAYLRALTLTPDHGEGRFNLGNLLSRQGRWREAAEQLSRAARLMPGHAGVRVNLSLALRALDRWAEAEAVLRQVLDMTDGHIAAVAPLWFTLASLCEARGRLEEAQDAYRRAVAADPTVRAAWLKLADLLSRRHRPDEALVCVERALDIPEAAGGGAAHALRLHLAARLCDWDRVASATPPYLACLEAGDGSGPPFVALCLDDPTPGDGGDAADWLGARQRQAARLHAAPYGGLARPAPSHGAPLRPAGEPAAGVIGGGRLRIGYLSADFHQHATAYLMAGVLEGHDRTRVETVALSYGPDDASPMRARLRAGVDRFLDLRDLDDAAAAAAIAAAGIDILVDLKGYTEGARPGIAARRPAPVQAQYLGYPGTLGAGWIDYVLADAIVLPPHAARWWDEAVVDLGGCYQANDAPRPIDPTPPRADLGLPEGAVVFACFNAAYKLTRPVVTAWGRILARVPGSVLWLLDPGPALPAIHAGLRAGMAQVAGGRVEGALAPEDRLIIAPAYPKARMAAHLARQAAADLFLDTLPVNAHTTAADALWAGLPLLTVAGQAFIGRVAASLLTALGLPDLVAPDLAAYEEMAVALAADGGRALADLRRRLALGRRRPGGPFDTAGLCRRLEWAYGEMARRHRAGLPPAAFAVPPDVVMGAPPVPDPGTASGAGQDF